MRKYSKFLFILLGIFLALEFEFDAVCFSGSKENCLTSGYFFHGFDRIGVNYGVCRNVSGKNRFQLTYTSYVLSVSSAGKYENINKAQDSFLFIYLIQIIPLARDSVLS